MNTHGNQSHLPQLSNKTFLCDGGLETTLVFQNGIDLPAFAAFTLVGSAENEKHLLNYFRQYADIARSHGNGLILETPTWRASADWGEQLGYSSEQLHEINKRSVEILSIIRDEFQNDQTPVVISGNLGPRGDGYTVEEAMSADMAEDYHAPQIKALTEAGADMICALTLNYVDEAIGITRAAMKTGVPVAISFTVEINGSLPSGQLLHEAIMEVDKATENGPAYYMINCAHPSHFVSVLQSENSWKDRIRGIRANASKMSHAELDEAEELDAGNPEELSCEYLELKKLLPNLNILGGCCGTDHTHIEAIASAWNSPSAS